MNTPNWFTVDKAGLAKLLERRAFAIFELLQNAWDADDVTMVNVRLEPIPNASQARLIVTDNSPNGFADLNHAYTLFAESCRKANPEKRGRINLGEKLALALCVRARITSTKGRIEFSSEGRTFSASGKSTSGTEFD